MPILTDNLRVDLPFAKPTVYGLSEDSGMIVSDALAFTKTSLSPELGCSTRPPEVIPLVSQDNIVATKTTARNDSPRTL